MNLQQLEQQFQGSTLAKLVEHHVRKMSLPQLEAAIQGAYLNFPEEDREIIDSYTLDFPTKWWLNTYFTTRDLSVIFADAIRENKRLSEKLCANYSDDLLFDIFNLTVMRVAHFASSNRGFRKQFGIRKGIFG